MSKGILYIVWGEQVNKFLNRSIDSVKKVHPELPVHIQRLESGNLLSKADMYNLSPFEETLFLDADTVVLDNLNFGFEKASKFGLALSICECPWARRYGEFKDKLDLIEYNTGVIFFTRNNINKLLFDTWKNKGDKIDSSIKFYRDNNLYKMPFNDQAGFTLALEETNTNPFILPLNWNFRPSWHKSFWGGLKIWHDYNDVPSDLVSWTQGQKNIEDIVQYVEFNGSNWERK